MIAYGDYIHFFTNPHNLKLSFQSSNAFSLLYESSKDGNGSSSVISCHPYILNHVVVLGMIRFAAVSLYIYLSGAHTRKVDFTREQDITAPIQRSLQIYRILSIRAGSSRVVCQIPNEAMRP